MLLFSYKHILINASKAQLRVIWVGGGGAYTNAVTENNSLSGIIGDKIFNKEIQVKMLPHVTVFQVCRAYYCLFVCGDTHRNRI